MYARRKNIEYARMKRTSRKPKPCDSFLNSVGAYFKLFLLWAVIMALDFLTEFRLEYMWPVWLLIRTINDSFKYQGMAFAVFFTAIALMSDIICYLLVPSSYLFLFGSTCVWIELAWHTERGICAPTVGMCFLFLYVEVAVRLRDAKSLPNTIDLCRPFAAHCIGYPVVTLGFGLKSLVSHQLRLRKQTQVETQNAKYFYLLDDALPDEARRLNRRGELANGQLPASNGQTPPANGTATTLSPASLPAYPSNSSSTSPPTTATNGNGTGSSSKSSRKQQQQQQQNQHLPSSAKAASVANGCSDHSLESRNTNTAASSSQTASSSGVNERKLFGHDDHQSHHQLKETPDFSAPSSTTTAAVDAVSSSSSSLSGQEPLTSEAGRNKKGGSGGSGGSPHQQCNSSTSTTNAGTTAISSMPSGGGGKSSRAGTSDGRQTGRSGKDPSIYRLEDELRRMRNERQNMMVAEAELRSQVAQLTAIERASRTEGSQARQEVEHLQSKLASVSQRLQTERDNLQVAEKRAADEKRQRVALEVSLAAEKRARKEAETALKATSTTGTSVGNLPPAIGSRLGAKLTTSTTTTPSLTSNPALSVAVGANRPMMGRCSSEACVHRFHEMEARITALSRDLAVKESQLAAQQQQQQHHHQPTQQTSTSFVHHPKQSMKQSQQQQQLTGGGGAGGGGASDGGGSGPRVSDLIMQIGDLQAENTRLKITLKAEDKMKQELLTGYHTSLKEITELNSTLTRKEYQIVNLNMQLDALNMRSPSYGYAMLRGAGGHVPPPDGSPDDVRAAHHSSHHPRYNGYGGGGGGVVPPSSSSSSDAGLFTRDGDFGDFIASTSSRWPTFTAGACATTSSPSSYPDHHQQNRIRSDSSSAVLNALLRESNVASHHQSLLSQQRFDLEAVSSHLPPTEFLSKLRSQLAMTAASISSPLILSSVSQAPISPPIRGGDVEREETDSDPGVGGDGGGSGTAGRDDVVSTTSGD